MPTISASGTTATETAAATPAADAKTSAPPPSSNTGGATPSTAPVIFPNASAFGIKPWSPQGPVTTSNRPRIVFFIPGASCPDYPADPNAPKAYAGATGCTLEYYELFARFEEIIENGYEIVIVTSQDEKEQRGVLAAKVKDWNTAAAISNSGKKPVDEKALPFTFVPDPECKFAATLNALDAVKTTLGSATVGPNDDPSLKRQIYKRVSLPVAANNYVDLAGIIVCPTPKGSADAAAAQSKLDAPNHVKQAAEYTMTHPFKRTPGPTSASLAAGGGTPPPVTVAGTPPLATAAAAATAAAHNPAPTPN